MGDRLRLSQETESQSGVTDIEKVPNRGHSLTSDSGWHEVADRALTSSSASCSNLRIFDLAAERSAGPTVASAKEAVITP
jgi:hypothetical protein